MIVKVSEDTIKKFFSQDFGELRVIVENGKLLFCAIDITRALGYTNGRDAVAKHCRREGVAKRDGVSTTTNQHGTTTQQQVELTYIDEGNLYRLITHSKLPTAEKFEGWVFDEVLPTIRKTGAYLPQFAVPKTYAEALQLAADQAKQIEENERQLAAAKPKVIFAETVEASTNSILVGQLAKLMAQKGAKIGQNRLFKWLRENGYICTRGGNRNCPTQQSIEAGLLETNERTVMKPDGSALTVFTTMVTGKGQVYFVNKYLECQKAA